jgi:D-alanyl-D-alanine carboxypeptidase
VRRERREVAEWTVARVTTSGILIVSLACTPKGDLTRLVDDVRLEHDAPGALLGILADGDTAIVVASGLADHDARSPLQRDDPFFLGSISKTYTATTVMRLVEDGRITLDDAIGTYLPLPRGDEITVRQLLDHTSGLKDFYSYLYFRPDREEMLELVTKDWTRDELLALAGRFGHWFEPGTDWSYSSTNYYLLGVAIERASGLALPDAYRRYLYEPLGLERTWLAWHEPSRGDLPTGYMGHVDGWEHSQMFGDLGPTTALDRSPVEWGAGGLAATAADAMHFLSALMTGTLVRDSTLIAMTDFRSTPPLGTASDSDADDGYGLGLVRMQRAAYTLIGHGGLFTGHTSGLWYLPECRVTVSLYFNRGFVNQRAALDRVLPVLRDGGRLGTCS